MSSKEAAQSASNRTLSPAGQAKTTPVADKQGEVCYVDVFKLTDLPGIMDKAGWTVGATLMKKWFENGGRVMNREEKTGDIDSRKYPPHLVDTTSVTMRWALSFPRIKKAYSKIFGSKGVIKSAPPLYESRAAQMQLVRRLARAGKFRTLPDAFGDLTSHVLDINEMWQFQRHEPASGPEYVKTWLKDSAKGDPDLDDMWAALANFLFKIAGQGFVTPKIAITHTESGSNVEVLYYEISVTKIGVYIRDTYDFNEYQYLGHWSKALTPPARVHPATHFIDGKVTKGPCPDDYVPVENESFRLHRDLTAKGGDLLVFSDVAITSLKKSFTFRVTTMEIKQIMGPSW